MALKLEPGTRLVVATHNAGKVRELDGEPETITFALPKELRIVGSGTTSASI